MLKNNRLSSLLTVLPFICLVLSLLTSTIHAWGSSHEKVKLKDVQALTLYNGKMTTGRRSSPVKQIACIGGDAKYDFVPEVIQCQNVGFDGKEVQWKCTAEMEDIYRFGQTTVTCEGYDYADDPYVLAGSCGVEYTLHYTEKGKQWKREQQSSSSNSYYSNEDRHYSDTDVRKGESGGGWFWIIVFLFIIYYIVNCTGNSSSSANGTNGAGYRPPGGYGGPDSGPGFDPHSQPPPPYNPNTYDSCQSPPVYPPPPRTQSSGPGFWSGFFSGGGLGYFAGRSSNRGYRGTQNTWSSGSSFSSSSSSSSSSSTSRTTPSVRSSSGFGGTKRR